MDEVGRAPRWFLVQSSAPGHVSQGCHRAVAQGKARVRMSHWHCPPQIKEVFRQGIDLLKEVLQLYSLPFPRIHQRSLTLSDPVPHFAFRLQPVPPLASNYLQPLLGRPNLGV